MTKTYDAVRALLDDIAVFSRAGIRTHPLRPYQVEPVEAVVRSVRQGLGLQFAWVFSRQAGKDEQRQATNSDAVSNA